MVAKAGPARARGGDGRAMAAKAVPRGEGGPKGGRGEYSNRIARVYSSLRMYVIQSSGLNVVISSRTHLDVTTSRLRYGWVGVEALPLFFTT
mmetsp:Transcript_27425/g.68827  ORF Transcript_27425/g.68827 Transcript_27425/m.68827 type:complete len:92 (-) Transcript_27425:1088-1363(-)